MALIYARDGCPGTHALLVGVGRYRHLRGGRDPRPEVIELVGDLGQLTSPPLSARALAQRMIDLAELWRPPLRSVELLVGGGRRAVTRLAIQRAYGRWRRRCDSAAGNLALAYFGGHGLQAGEQFLLPEDFGADPLRPWANAINLDRTQEGFRRCRAGGQVFWFDTCRQVSDSVLAQGLLDGQPLESPALRQVDRRAYGMVLRAAGPGAAAYAAVEAPSLFTTALLAALSPAARLPVDGARQLTCGAVAIQMSRMLDGLASGAVQCCEADELVDGPLLCWPETACKPRSGPECRNERASATEPGPRPRSRSMERKQQIDQAYKHARAAMASLKAAREQGYGDLKRANLDTATERVVEAVFALTQALRIEESES